jgi:methionyl-tRNA formyltransferase
LIRKTNTLQKNPVQLLAESANIPCLTPETLNEPTLLPTQPDILFTAGYGKLLPESWLEFPSIAALNLHFSLLPKYRGANPAEWALLLGETETGVSIIEMSPEFDTGKIIAQSSLPISDADTRVSIYQKLYELGGSLSAQVCHDYANKLLTAGLNQGESPTPYAKRFTRQDGFVAWHLIQVALNGQTITSDKLSEFAATAECGLLLAKAYAVAQVSWPNFIERACRALAEYPTLWTEIPTAKGPKQMKLLSCKLHGPQLVLENVHIAGQQPALWNQVKNSVQK